jgi:hypothetical protein
MLLSECDGLLPHVLGTMDLAQARTLLRRTTLAAACTLFWRCSRSMKNVPLTLLATANPAMSDAVRAQAVTACKVM